MDALYPVNGLIFWNEQEIALRDHLKRQFALEVRNLLKAQNKAWELVEIEAPLLTPLALINPNYTEQDVWLQQKFDNEEQLVLRPETTPGSYLVARHLLDTHSGIKTPVCVYQSGKSFRREQDQVSKNVRLKEFYQQEFQCIFTSDTKNDYQAALLEPLRDLLSRHIGLPARLVDSERLPSYSRRTVDVEVENGDKWMEVCSISLRTDFPGKLKFGTVERDLLVLEIAIGLDRCVYNLVHKSWAKKGAAQ